MVLLLYTWRTVHTNNQDVVAFGLVKVLHIAGMNGALKNKHFMVECALNADILSDPQDVSQTTSKLAAPVMVDSSRSV